MGSRRTHSEMTSEVKKIRLKVDRAIRFAKGAEENKGVSTKNKKKVLQSKIELKPMVTR